MPVSFLDMGARACRFPVSGAGLDMMVCGEPAPAGASYCPACRARAYQPVPARPTRPVACGYTRVAAEPVEREQDLTEVFA